MPLLLTIFISLLSSILIIGTTAIASPHHAAINPAKLTPHPESASKRPPRANAVNSAKLRTLLREYDNRQLGKVTKNEPRSSVQRKMVYNRTAPNIRYTALKKDPGAKALVKRGLLKSARQKSPEYRHAVTTKMLFSYTSRITDDIPDSLAFRTLHTEHYLRVRQNAVKKLLEQLGKPYQWGGASPYSGFDCSGLVYYAYKDLVKTPLPRTANEMFHHRDAASVNKNELEQGDLVFFRIHKGSADHVGVYLGNNRFIQSPRTGSDIRISKLTDEYWQAHYVGARRVVTPQTIR